MEFTLLDKDQIEKLNKADRSDYVNKLEQLYRDARAVDYELSDNERIQSVLEKFQTYVGKWMYAERGIGNNPTIAYIAGVKLSEREFQAIELDMIHYAPNYSRFPIRWGKTLCSISGAEQVYKNLSANANFYNQDKEYVEDPEACKKLMLDSKDSTIAGFTETLKKSCKAYEMLMEQIGAPKPDMDVIKTVRKMFAENNPVY